MTTIYISILSLIVSLFALWLSYRNRVERLEGEQYSRYIEAYTVLNNAELLFGQLEVSIREFTRIADTYAKIGFSDFGIVFEDIKAAKENIQKWRVELDNNKKYNDAITQTLEYGLRRVKDAESLLSSHENHLINLKNEVELSADLSEEDRIGKLRKVISDIKQWEKFNKPFILDV